MNRYLSIPLVASALTLGGCASIVSGHNQPVSLETKQGGEAVIGANCSLTNDKGTWFITTPGSTTVSRSASDLAIKCEKPSVPTGFSTVKSSTKAMAFGNILFGGIIGAGVDISTGAAFDYPSLIQVQMGQTMLVLPPAGTTAAADVNKTPAPTFEQPAPAKDKL